jgi:hypothetical protein
MLHRAAFFALLLLAACTGQPRQPDVAQSPPAATDAAASNSEPLPEGWQYIDSVAAIKDLVFREFEAYREDSAYTGFVILTNKQEQLFYLEIKVGRLFQHSLPSAVLAWSNTDSTINVEVFHKKNGQWAPALQVNNSLFYNAGPPPDGAVILHCTDYNHDGWNDLEVITHWAPMAIHANHQSRLWLADRAQFIPVKNFENIISPEADPDRNLIHSYMSTGCADMAMLFEEWCLKADSVQRIRSVSIDCCNAENSACTVTIDEGTPLTVPGNKVHRYVPDYFREAVKEKVQN